MIEKQKQALNTERQRKMVADADHLLELATQLDKAVAQSKDGKVTVEQMKLVEEIEKLAHSVREKMADPNVGGFDPALPALIQPHF